MIPSNIIHRALFLATLIWFCTPLAHSAPAELDKRLRCNQDNCLRALLANKVPASTFCLDYIENFFTPTATYTSVCTEKPTAVSSACSCFRSIEATATTTTTALPTPTQCSAANNYGYAYAYNAFSFKSQYIFFNEYSTSKPGDCCAKCYATPSCYSFSEIYGPSGQYCELGTIAAGTWPDVSTQCPLGRATGPFAGNLTPEPQGATSGANLGPCGAG